MIARSTSAAVNVIALVGERGREVREFIERDLGDALERSVVVVATSDQPALVRIKAAFTATTIAEHFRDQGHDVMLMMDSVTRFAMAQREVGLAIGEPPATRGYTPSVFALLPRLLERAGTSTRGSITGLYTVLVDGDDMNEPIADAVRSILDGHVVLTRSLAHAGHYPAIDVLQSVSRLIGEIVSPEVAAGRPAAARGARGLREKEDLISIGAYQPGSDPRSTPRSPTARAIEALPAPARRRSAASPRTTDARLLELAGLPGMPRWRRRAEDIPDAEEVAEHGASGPVPRRDPAGPVRRSPRSALAHLRPVRRRARDPAPAAQELKIGRPADKRSRDRSLVPLPPGARTRSARAQARSSPSRSSRTRDRRARPASRRELRAPRSTSSAPTPISAPRPAAARSSAHELVARQAFLERVEAQRGPSARGSSQLQRGRGARARRAAGDAPQASTRCSSACASAAAANTTASSARREQGRSTRSHRSATARSAA